MFLTTPRATALLGALLLPASAPVRVEHHSIEAQTITLALTATRTAVCCPCPTLWYGVSTLPRVVCVHPG
jgi:hypothetical protein